MTPTCSKCVSPYRGRGLPVGNQHSSVSWHRTYVRIGLGRNGGRKGVVREGRPCDDGPSIDYGSDEHAPDVRTAFGFYNRAT